MKKFLIINVFIILFGSGVLAQSNFGIFVGGGYSYANVNFESSVSGVSAIILNIGGAFEPSYHAGINFENVIIEKMLYFQLGLHGMSKGYKYSDNFFLIAHSAHIPLDIKYKYFFNKRGEAFIYSSIGAYVSASYSGIKYIKFDIDFFIDDNTGEYEMENPRIKFGKVLEDESADMSTFDYGLNFGTGVGLFGHLQIGFNYGIGFPVFEADGYDLDFDEENDTFNYYKHRYLTMTVAYYFSNQ